MQAGACDSVSHGIGERWYSGKSMALARRTTRGGCALPGGAGRERARVAARAAGAVGARAVGAPAPAAGSQPTVRLSVARGEPFITIYYIVIYTLCQ